MADIFGGTRIALMAGESIFLDDHLQRANCSKFNIQILPVDMVGYPARNRVRENRSIYREQVAELRNQWIVEGFNDEPLMNIWHDQGRWRKITI